MATTPTKGRIVYFKHHAQEDTFWPAMVVAVDEDGTVDLNVNIPGQIQLKQNIVLCQKEDTPPSEGEYCYWMPYQIAQAEKAEAAEVKK